MIIVWPMVVSKTVNPNILPGVCKALEKYIYIYSMDAVINTANENIKANRSSSRSRGILRMSGKSIKFEHIEGDNENYMEESFIEEDYLEEAGGPNVKSRGQTFVSSTNSSSKNTTTVSGPSNTYNIQQPKSQPEKRDPYKDEKEKLRAQDEYKQLTGVEPTIGKMDPASISNEPTWNVITDQQGRTTAIGVKVVPFVITNEESLIKLITLDRYREKLNRNVHVQARKLMKLMHRLGNTAWRNTLGRFLSWTGFVDKDLIAGTVTQNWKNDIILQNTAFEDRMFILLNKMDLEDDFTSTAKGVKNLFKLGWTSFVVADDMNKTVNFCMKEYKGMCSMVNYGFLYADARTQSQVYQDIEDIRKSSGPLFRMKGQKINMITDNLAQYKLNQYSEITESYLIEGLISDTLKQIKNSPSAITSNLKSIASAIKRNDIKTAETISKKFNPGNKKINTDEILSKASENSVFKKHFELSKMVFKNSLPGIDDETSKMAALILASFSSLNKDKNYDVKNDIKKVVVKTRELVKSLEEDDDNFNKDLRLSLIFAVFYIVFQGALLVTLLYALVAVFPVIASSVAAIAPYAFILLIISAGFQFLKMKREENK